MNTGRIFNPEYLQGFWPLRKDAKDYSGHGRDGTFSNHSFIEGPFNGKDVAAFNGSNSLFTVPDEEALRPGTSDFSICAWVKSDQTGASRFYIGKSTGTSSGTSLGWWLVLASSGTQHEFTISESGGFAQATEAGTTTANEWVHICGVFRSEKAELFRNAKYDNFRSQTRTVDLNNTSDLTIGYLSPVWDGDVYAVRYYPSIALTESEIAEIREYDRQN